MRAETQNEAQRQLTVCNACRYCEGYCSVFPEITRHKDFGLAEISHLANLCHNCRGCFYACQFTAPHEFDLNLPQILATARQESWTDFAFPSAFARRFQTSGAAISLAMIAGIAAIFALAQTFGRLGNGEGFYAVISHALMVAIFMPAFLLPLAVMAVGLRRYWKQVGGGRVQLGDIRVAVLAAATMKNLSGGHGEGCNYEDGDGYSNTRRILHHLAMYGFLLCFASTSSATFYHYCMDYPAPYPLFSLPKLFGISGGLSLSLGTLGLMWLKTKSDTTLDAAAYRSGDFAFVMLLFLVSTTGLLLYVLGFAGFLVAEMLIFHLGTVLTLFVLLPYSKMAHGFYRFAALLQDAARKRETMHRQGR